MGTRQTIGFLGRVATATVLTYAILVHALLAQGAAAAPNVATVVCGHGSQGPHDPTPTQDDAGCCTAACCAATDHAFAPPPSPTHGAKLRLARLTAWPAAATAVLRSTPASTGTARGPPLPS